MSRITNENILNSMRMMAWERAKGELRSMSQASYHIGDEETDKRRMGFLEIVEEFITKVEKKELCE